MIVYTLHKPVTELQPGDIVVSHGMALYLRQQSSAMLGERVWQYDTYSDDGKPHRGSMTFRASVTVPVVCTLLDGSALVGSAEVTS